MAQATVDLGRRMDSSIRSDMTNIAQDAELYAKDNAPWTDRTTELRETIECRMNQTGRGNYTIICRYNRPYGGFLETGTSHNAPYPILRPTLQAHYAPVRAAMDRAASFGGAGASI